MCYIYIDCCGTVKNMLIGLKMLCCIVLASVEASSILQSLSYLVEKIYDTLKKRKHFFFIASASKVSHPLIYSDMLLLHFSLKHVS